jgi:ppGpp synthetase/RelA/SpoT-type nucleotidyltranferase
MDLIEKELLKINFVVQQYSDECDNAFANTTTIITNKLKKIIDELASQFFLISINSVRKTKHYSFSTRVKDAESLKEKIIRNNLFSSSFSVEDGFDPENGDLISSVKDELFNLDDLIGIKILADLNSDCVRMYELIKSPEFISRAKAQGIILNESDLRSQPQTMRNGLKIYKIKGKYEKYNFELQIKSKIISAWGDMEHSIFYKDYSVSPVRDTTQSSMNHVGKLLFEIDDFLESIRIANSHYKQNAKALSFLQWFDSNYNSKISVKLDNVGFRIDGISELLYAVYLQLPSKINLENKLLRYDHFELDIKDPILASYSLIRNKFYDLKILESIVLGWILEDDQIVSEDRIESDLTTYLETLQNATTSFLIFKNPGLDEEEVLEILKGYYTIAFKYRCSERFLLDINNLNSFFLLRASLIDIAELALDDENLKNILTTIFITINKGDLQSFVHDEIEAPIQLKKDLIMLKETVDYIDKRSGIKIKSIFQSIIDQL